MDLDAGEGPALGELPVGGVQEQGLGLPAAEAAVGADQLLEGHDLVERGVERAEQDQVADVVAPVEVEQVGRREGAVRRHRVLARAAHHAEVGDQLAPAAGTTGDQAPVLTPGEDQADLGVGGEPVDQPGVVGLDPLQRDPPGRSVR